MKLVEILARELREWPEGASLIVQDYDGEVKYQFSGDFPEIENGRVWLRTLSDEPGCGVINHYRASIDYDTAIVTREMWEAERAKLKRDSEWDGEGLPPSGTDVEYLSYLGKWKKGRYLGEFVGRSVCGDYETGAVGYVEGIRPIRTPEQSAAQERELVLDDIYRIIRNVDRPGNKADMAEALYDAGYRKQEKDQ